MGLRYFVYNWEVEVEWKEYIDCVIEACNVGGAVVAPDNVLQLMTKAHCHAMIWQMWPTHCMYATNCLSLANW